jgi:toxin ParE1/3/4
MTPQFDVNPQADRDLDEHYLFIRKDSPQAAVRLLRAADATFRQLARMPQLGAVYPIERPDLAGLRVWQVKGFPNHLIFYRPIHDGIEVIRVLHGSRDIPASLNEWF